MKTPSSLPSLVERKQYDDKRAHQIAEGVWWVGYRPAGHHSSHNPVLLIDGGEAVLINPGSRADDHHRRVKEKVVSLIEPKKIRHIVILHESPDWCASLPLFEKLAGRDVKLYAPPAAVQAIAFYGCKSSVITLNEGEGIILGSGRTLDYFDLPGLHPAGYGFLHDPKTGTIFSGNILGYPAGEWNLYAPSDGWESLTPCETKPTWSKKAHLRALNKIERLSPERLCPQDGPIFEDDIDKYIEAARKSDTGR